MTDNRTTETATSCIIATLRERGVQFATHGNTDRVWWTTENGVTWYAQDRPNANDLFVKLEAVLTPEQAIAATLGSRTSSSEAANPQIRCTDSKRNALVRDREDSHTLLPCPFCGGEANKQKDIDKYAVGCSSDICLGFIGLGWLYNTEAEAIAAWNTRTELGSGECKSYGQYHKQAKRENDSKRESSDARCHQLFGTLTDEQVRSALLRCMPPREYYSVEQTDGWQAIADELNVELGKAVER